MIGGPDVSSYQPDCDWPAVRASGAELAIVKVTQGNGSTNKYAAQQVKGAIAAGLLVMLYHFAQPNGPNWKEDAAAEAKRLDDIADQFERELGTYPIGHPSQGEPVKLFCFLDVERNTPLTAVEKPLWREWCNEFRRWSREIGKRAIGFYSGKYFTMDLGFDASWTNTILWVAQYPSVFRIDGNYGFWPKNITPWFRGDLWQDGGGDSVAAGGNASTCPGIKGGCDYNHFAGTRSELEELIAVAA